MSKRPAKRQAKSEAICLRVPVGTRRKFHEQASRFGIPSDVMRELIIGFIEGRVTVAPPPNQKESLYNVSRSES